MTNTAEQLEIEEVPSGGIGDFVMSEEDFRVLERQNAAEEYGNEGIARFEDTASRIAAYGRFGDDQVAHVETGELIVPRQLIDQSPELKNSIFQHLREAGIEDPERYVVGNAENSINPETGLMEFGFFSKIFKGIKKAFKKIGKVLKKAAPIILSVALAGPLGAVYGGMVGQGIGTLIQGGSIKDAFKAAAIGGLTGAAFSGIGGAIDPNQTALGAIQESLANPGLRFSQAGANIKDALTGQGEGGFFKTLARQPGDAIPTDVRQAIDPLTGKPYPEAVKRGTISPTEMAEIDAQIARQQSQTLPKDFVEDRATGDLIRGATPQDVSVPGAENLTRGQNFRIETFDPNAPLQAAADTPSIQEEYIKALSEGRTRPTRLLSDTTNLSDVGTTPAGTGVSSDVSVTRPDFSQLDLTPDSLKGAFDSFPELPFERLTPPPGVRGTATGFLGNLGEAGKDILQGEFRDSLTNLKEAFFPKLVGQTADELAISKGFEGITDDRLTDAARTRLIDQAGKVSLGQKALAYAPAAGLAALAGGFFETPPMEEAGLVERDEEGNIIRGDDYLAADPFRFRIFPTGFQPTYRPPVNPIVPYSAQRVAEGGEIFPRRTGGIMPDEGIPNEDSVKAMLMPGEFVMTTTAVRGAGDGDLNKGINNMYSVMRNLEARGRAMS